MIANNDYSRSTVLKHDAVCTTWSNGQSDAYTYYLGEDQVNKIGYMTSEYRALRKAGKSIPPTPLRFSSIGDTGWTGQMGNTVYGRRAVIYPFEKVSTYAAAGNLNMFVRGSLPLTYQLPDWIASNTRNEAVQKLRESVKDMKISLAQTIAEATKTSEHLVTTARRIIDCYRDLKRGKLRSAARRINIRSVSRGLRRRFKRANFIDPHGAASSAFLELQYGWKPLIGDMQGMAEQIAKMVSGQDALQKASGAAKYEDTKRSAISSDRYINGLNSVRTYRYSVRYTAEYRVHDLALQTTASVGFQNPLGLAWELTPFSCIADYLIDIGGFLNSLDGTLGCSFINGCCITADELNVSGMAYWSSYGDDFTRVSAYGNASRTYISRNRYREVITGFPSMTAPVIQMSYSLTKQANTLAVLGSILAQRN